MATACDYMAVRFGTLSSDFLCGLISGASRTCAWITELGSNNHEKNRASISSLRLVGLEGADHGK